MTMKKLITLLAALFISYGAFAQSPIIGELSGLPTGKSSKQTLVGALVTLTGVWDKEATFKRVVNENGFTLRLPYGDYVLRVEMEGYETYKLEIEINDERTDLGIMKMFTNEEVEAKRLKRAKRAE